jgi:RNA polymerase sigma factor (sigma-70 family)
MANGRLGPVLGHLRHLLGASTAGSRTDGQLLDDFVSHRDETAFAALLQRHGPMVFGVCRRLLPDPHEVEDAFQATFLVLLRKAGSIAKVESVGSWLYGVAYRAASRARSQLQKRQARQRPLVDAPEEEASALAEVRELKGILDEELHGLPEKYRAPLVLHYLGGKTKGETARQLGWSEGTVSGRLFRGRQLLQARLARRGLAVPAGLAALELANAGAAAAPVRLLEATLQAALHLRAGLAAGAVFSERALGMAEGVARGLFATKLKVGAGLLVLMSALAVGAAWVARQGWPGQAPAARQEAPPAERAGAVRKNPPKQADAPIRKATDLYGDPLPPGAVARLGSNRGRHALYVSALAFSRDGKILATHAQDGTVRLWDAAGKELHVFRGDPESAKSALVCFAMAPDGRTLAGGGADGTVRFWNLTTGRRVRQVRANRVGVRSLAFSADGKLLAVAGEDNSVCLRDPATLKEVRCLPGEAPNSGAQGTGVLVKEVVFSPESKTLGVLRLPPPGLHMSLGPYGQTPRGCLELWDVAEGKRTGRFQAPPASRALALLPDGKALVWIEAGRASLKAADTGREIRAFGPNNRSDRALALTPDGRTLAVASAKAIQLWDVGTGETKGVLKDSANRACLAFTRDGQTLAAAGDDGAFQVWDVASGKKRYPPFPGHGNSVASVAYAPDGKTLATCCAIDGTIRLWEAATGKEIRRWEAHRGLNPTFGPLSLAFSPDGKTLVSGGQDQMLRLWEVAGGKEIRHFPETEPKALAFHHKLQFSPDGKFVATMNYSGAVRLWTLTGKEVRRFQEASSDPSRLGPSRALVFSADGKFLAATGGKVVRLWETATGREVRRFEGHTSNVTALALSPDGTALASAGMRGGVRLWQVATGKQGRLLRKPLLGTVEPISLWQRLPASPVTALAFGPGGRALLGGDSEGTLSVWDLARDRPARKVYAHKELVTGLAVSRDHQRLATASGDRTVLVWDLARLAAPP